MDNSNNLLDIFKKLNNTKPSTANNNTVKKEEKKKKETIFDGSGMNLFSQDTNMDNPSDILLSDLTSLQASNVKENSEKDIEDNVSEISYPKKDNKTGAVLFSEDVIITPSAGAKVFINNNKTVYTISKDKSSTTYVSYDSEGNMLATVTDCVPNPVKVMLLGKEAELNRDDVLPKVVQMEGSYTWIWFAGIKKEFTNGENIVINADLTVTVTDKNGKISVFNEFGFPLDNNF